MKCMVTGARGFIGSHLVKELRKRGHEILECDPKIDLASDIRKLNATDLEGVDVIFHLGAASGSLHFLPTPEDGINVNCDGTTHLLEVAKEAKVKKVIFASTGSSYGGTPLPHKEEAVLNIPNFYTATKIFDEFAMKLYHDLYKVETIILRYASVYGDNEDSKILPQGNLANVVSQFIWKMIKGEPADLWYTGKQTRDLIFVDDIVYANIFAADNLEHGIYNVGTGIETSFTDIVKKINVTLGTNIEPIFKGDLSSVQTKYVDRQLFDITKLVEKGWKPTITIDEGIRRIVTDIRSRK